jgi:hypothetical protein
MYLILIIINLESGPKFSDEKDTIPPLDLGHLRKTDAYHLIQWSWTQAEWVYRQQSVFYSGLTSYFMRNE